MMGISAGAGPGVESVIRQHAEELAILWGTRRLVARSGHVGLRHLSRFDERIAAHADGILVNGAAGLAAVRAQLDPPDQGRIFAATLSALGAGDEAALEACLALVEALPACRAGAASAFGWASRQNLAGVVRDLLSASAPVRRWLAISACRLHGADPGATLEAFIGASEPLLRAAGWRAAATLARADLRDRARSCAAAEEDPDARLWAAACAVFQGDRTGAAIEALTRLAQDGERTALRLLLSVLELPAAREFLRGWFSDPARARGLIEAVGIVGDPVVLPWLLERFADPKLARAAGESFALITGLDLAYQDLDRKPPTDFEEGPNDNPEDPNVEPDPDQGLPWPDPDRLRAWWSAHRGELAAGSRLFMGQAPAWEHCVGVLNTGFQRQRRLAAHYLSLQRPQTTLFNTETPAWRQRRLLARMT